ncbi:putative tail fiber chaperone [Bacillus phage Kirov]|uniref:Putative tail fiber chaperone n=1 Tax=Bacillus phage Kirov TaxID=2783539 RepID=A0A7U3RWH5_9CAUD|nr:putative tail fiber chaperone [Bacillus phage Kirov]QOV08254.1 putative tail fiber chaperone [Bacillus phage Kirov]
MQGQLDINIVIKEYQEKVAELTNELIMKNAYIKQLEKQILDEAEAKSKEDKSE